MDTFRCSNVPAIWCGSYQCIDVKRSWGGTHLTLNVFKTVARWKLLNEAQNRTVDPINDDVVAWSYPFWTKRQVNSIYWALPILLPIRVLDLPKQLNKTTVCWTNYLISALRTPLLVGLSRKSMITKALDIDTKDTLTVPLPPICLLLQADFYTEFYDVKRPDKLFPFYGIR